MYIYIHYILPTFSWFYEEELLNTKHPQSVEGMDTCLQLYIDFFHSNCFYSHISI